MMTRSNSALGDKTMEGAQPAAPAQPGTLRYVTCRLALIKLNNYSDAWDRINNNIIPIKEEGLKDEGC